ncbi:hypothetical protein LJ655_10845 [Paraburkholderia sp. MMS20-SJTN17]|uniref:Uncharacterized protein n=1 Tax=Paraburkholderia translucens TaxID=2886945 RepID=A0ABS8KD23_9BURK|nr:hypothetical protein [Paraburkholderia sp. MMS20-SJTN17]MCC8402383.1 hypothetical protein [Paraburkholderia sp. MMS20-SJTN17]
MSSTKPCNSLLLPARQIRVAVREQEAPNFLFRLDSLIVNDNGCVISDAITGLRFPFAGIESGYWDGREGPSEAPPMPRPRGSSGNTRCKRNNAYVVNPLFQPAARVLIVLGAHGGRRTITIMPPSVAIEVARDGA